MITGDGIVLGAGGETASIVVTGPTGSTVTCTTPAGIVLNAAEVSGTWTFARLKVYGTYTITATNGTDEATLDVLVDSANVFNVEIYYKLWLYKDGDECEDVTGGWIRITSGYSYSNASFAPNGTYNQFIKRSDRMSLTSYSIYSTLVSTSKAIDFTGYTTIHVEYELEGPSLIISTPERSDLANPLYPLSFSEDGSADISIPGEAYPFFLSYSGHPVDVKKVWLE